MGSLPPSYSVFIKSQGLMLQPKTPKANPSYLTATDRPNCPRAPGALPHPQPSLVLTGIVEQPSAPRRLQKAG